MMWFVIVPPWLFFTVMGISVVVGIWTLIGDMSDERDARQERQWTNDRLEEIEVEAIINAHIAKVVPGGVLVLEDRLKRLAATRKVPA